MRRKQLDELGLPVKSEAEKNPNLTIRLPAFAWDKLARLKSGWEAYRKMRLSLTDAVVACIIQAPEAPPVAAAAPPADEDAGRYEQAQAQPVPAPCPDCCFLPAGQTYACVACGKRCKVTPAADDAFKKGLLGEVMPDGSVRRHGETAKKPKAPGNKKGR